LGLKLESCDDPRKLITDTFAKLVRPRLGVINIIHRLRAAGYGVDGFSNTNLDHLALMKERGWTEALFTHFFASCKLKTVKPNIKAYKYVIQKIGVHPRDIVFIDNTCANVQGASKSGIGHPILYRSIRSLEIELRAVLHSYSKSPKN
jgi:HAD superfamily hydrolase (TIGR01509 family)